ncbi:hypothetical protein EZV73_06980 [Acidaminobacter sp. JC074]|uniref:hydrogen gas-evolving membrane-bound hydrogenase subunit E n=1 Tax=Acidaminobacter sp. JC074 TaxID=2530199 RepID=UPI001F114F5F|nr:hydrogen gas-evolving membrane-bound hydrogenase subunit E [Acidaminobacter sp. JC074]MCH4887308.1 hypothetical protein [Acidaminobacter sp. JC074]
MKRVRGFLVAVVIIYMMFQIMWHINGDSLEYNTSSHTYYVENGLEETSSKNLVTAIYLDYRLFDSFFEASILLVAVTGIAFMAIKDEDLL